MLDGSRKAVKAQTRVRLIEAGMALFGEQGLDAPSLDAICDRAGFTRGAFYVHFQDREDFLAAVMEHVGQPILDRLIGADSEATLAEIATRFLNAVEEGSYPLGPRGGIRPHQLLDACARNERIRGLYVGLVVEATTRLRFAIARAQAVGELRADLDAEGLAALLMASILGAQTMLELEVPLSLPAIAGGLLGALAPSSHPLPVVTVRSADKTARARSKHEPAPSKKAKPRTSKKAPRRR